MPLPVDVPPVVVPLVVVPLLDVPLGDEPLADVLLVDAEAPVVAPVDDEPPAGLPYPAVLGPDGAGAEVASTPAGSGTAARAGIGALRTVAFGRGTEP